MAAGRASYSPGGAMPPNAAVGRIATRTAPRLSTRKPRPPKIVEQLLALIFHCKL